MSAIRHVTVAAIAAATLTGCATMTAGSYAQRGIDFAQYHTYTWGAPDALPTGDPRLDANPFFEDHFEGAVERQLARNGFGRMDENPDLLIHYHANITQRLEVHGVDTSYPCRNGDDCQPRASEYDSGTLVLDFVDARTSKVVWRGWAQSNVTGIITDQDRLERYISDAVRRIFERFPGS
jgi:hypothetical protein